MKLLLLDIENTPNLAWIWQARNDYISHKMLEQEREIMCFAAKWYQDPFTYWYNGEDMIEAAHHMMSEADAIITFNGKRHDIPILNQEFARRRMKPPSPSKHIDLYQVGKTNFNLFSNSLEYTLNYFGLPGKSSSGGMSTWLDCMNPRSKRFKSAWVQMEKYNRDDVVIMEPLYEFYLPWITSHPHVGLYNDTECCKNCGGVNLTREGFAFLVAGKYQRFSCDDCGTWQRSAKKEPGGVSTR